MLYRPPDAIVIGAGIVGASIAWRLAQAGRSVTLLDAGELGGEASWAGAGMLAPGGEFTAQAPLASFAIESLGLYPAFVQELESEARTRIDYRRCGAVEIACTEAEWRDLLERRAAQQALGIRSSVRTGAFGAAGVLFYPDEAIVDPRDVTRALRCACHARQVRILEQTRVLQIRLAAHQVDLETSAGRLSASAAVLAAGAWSAGIPVTHHGEPIAITPTFPVRGHLLGYTLPPGSLGPILRRAHTYLLQRANGFTIAGTSSEQAGFDRRLDPAVIAGIHARACELMPRLRSAPEPQAWLGFRPATADFEPCIGRLGDTPLWLAYGHYRNGILLAPATARRVTLEMTSSSETGSPAPGALG
jgi:glycine oxidase